MGMNKYGLPFLFLLLPFGVHAQEDSIAKARPPHTRHLALEVRGAYDSNVLYNDLVMGLYNGGWLSKEIRQRSMDAMGKNNRAGYEQAAKLTYTWGQRSIGRRIFRSRTSLSQQSYLGLHFATDAYALSFFGNKQFEDRSAQVGPSAFAQVSYQQVAFGLEEHSTGSYLEVGLVNGSRLNSGKIRRADLYTAPAAEYIEVDLNGSYARADTAAAQWSKGIGAAISLRWCHGLTLFKNDARITLGTEDLGFVAWANRSLSVAKDSLIRFEGLTADGLLDLDGLILDQHELQDSLGLGYTQDRFATLLPALFWGEIGLGRVRHAFDGRVKHAWVLMVAHRLLPGYRPHVSVKHEFHLNDALACTVGLAHGGFGDLRVLLGLEASVGQHLSFAAETMNATGFLPGFRGKALLFKAAWAW